MVDLGTSTADSGDRTALHPSLPVHLKALEKNRGGVSGKRVQPNRNRVPREVDKLHRSGHQPAGVGGVGAAEIVRSARAGGHTLVCCSKAYRPVKLLSCSTQNKIKNHFYGTLRNLIRFVVAHFDGAQNCYNSQISHLPPSYLNSLYNAT